MKTELATTDEGQPRPKYIFNKCGTNIYSFTTLQRFGPSPSPNFKSFEVPDQAAHCNLNVTSSNAILIFTFKA